MKANIENVTSISVLQIYHGVAAGSQTIFANGKHQAFLDIYVVAFDSELHPIKLGENELKQIVSLVDYETGEKLGAGASQGWEVTENDNGFPPLPAQEKAGEINAHLDIVTLPSRLRLYITCDLQAPKRTLNVAVTVQLANGKEFSTSRNSKANMPGVHSHVVVAAIDPIDYSKAECWHIKDGEYETAVSDVNCSFEDTVDRKSVWKSDYIGMSRWKIISAECNLNSFSNSITVDASSVEICKIESRDALPMILKSPAQAVAGRNTDDGFDFMSWFVAPKVDTNVGIDHGELALLPSAWFFSSRRKFVIGRSDRRHFCEARKASPMEFKIYLWNLSMPRRPYEKDSWENNIGRRAIRIGDKFGNESVLTLKFEYDQDLPRVVE